MDLIIAGAGPAGLSLALHLLHADPSWSERMILLEKAAHPRQKLCGGGVTRLGLCILKDLGFSLPLPIPQTQVDEVRLEYAGRVVHVRGQPQIAVFHRLEFDAYLAEQARQRGVQIHENEPVKDFQLDRDGVRVITPQREYHAQVLAGADGSKGRVRTYMNRLRARSRSARSQAARLLEVLAPADGEAAPFSERYARFDFTPVREHLQGYYWEFPARVRGAAAFNRGVYDARLFQARPRADLPRLLRASLGWLEGVPVEIRPEGHPIHWFSPWNPLALPRLLLLGDAAGADPLFGEGIAPALAYGRVAAQTVQHAFARGDFSFHDYRWRLFRSPAGRYLLVRWWVAMISYHLSSQRWFMHALWLTGQALSTLRPDPPPLYADMDKQRMANEGQEIRIDK